MLNRISSRSTDTVCTEAYVTSGDPELATHRTAQKRQPGQGPISDLEGLSNELLLDIFDYADATSVVKLGELNTRFQSLANLYLPRQQVGDRAQALSHDSSLDSFRALIQDAMALKTPDERVDALMTILGHTPALNVSLKASAVEVFAAEAADVLNTHKALRKRFVDHAYNTSLSYQTRVVLDRLLGPLHNELHMACIDGIARGQYSNPTHPLAEYDQDLRQSVQNFISHATPKARERFLFERFCAGQPPADGELERLRRQVFVEWFQLMPPRHQERLVQRQYNRVLAYPYPERTQPLELLELLISKLPDESRSAFDSLYATAASITPQPPSEPAPATQSPA